MLSDYWHWIAAFEAGLFTCDSTGRLAVHLDTRIVWLTSMPALVLVGAR